MAYGHAERNLACMRQLEADLRKQMELRAGTELDAPVEANGTRGNASKQSPETR